MDFLRGEFGPSAVKEFERFLTLRVKHGEKITPGPLNDTLWHELMLRPVAYAKTCALFTDKGVIDHDPQSVSTDERKSFTRDAYQREFGTACTWFKRPVTPDGFIQVTIREWREDPVVVTVPRSANVGDVMAAMKRGDGGCGWDLSVARHGAGLSRDMSLEGLGTTTFYVRQYDC